MAYTVSNYLSPVLFDYPRGYEITQKTQVARGLLVQSETPGYMVGGIGSTIFEVTDITAAGVCTYSNLRGLQLVNGQLVTLLGASTSGNNGVKTISNLVATTAVAGHFQIDSYAGTHDSTQTVNGVGELRFGTVAFNSQTFTVASVVATATTVAYTYTTLVGPQFQVGQSVTIAGCSHSGNNGTFIVKSVKQTSITAGTITCWNTGGTSTDSGTGTANLKVGISAIDVLVPPTQVLAFSQYSGTYAYTWNPVSRTLRIATASSELATSASTWAYDLVQFEAIFPLGGATV
jgi:hypothetical protein